MPFLRSAVVAFVTVASSALLIGCLDGGTGEGELIIEDLVVGEGAVAEAGDSLTVHYSGRLLDGPQFESSHDREPITIRIGVGQVIRGWDQGVPGMRVGGIRKLTIPPSLAYGRIGTPVIPPNATLVFEISLLNVVKPDTTTG